MSGSSYQVRAYNIRHGYGVRGFLEAYRLLLRRAVDEIWAGIKWVERQNGRGRRLMRAPMNPRGVRLMNPKSYARLRSSEP